METEKAIERDWSLLLPEVLTLIAKGLCEVSDFVRFRAVCTAWRSSAPITDLPPQFPWILEYKSSLKFYSMSTEKIYNIHAPNSVGQLLYEITEGYLLFELWDQSQRTTQSFLLNPLNNHKIPLPACDYYPNWFEQRQNQIGEYGICCELARRVSKPELVLCCLGQDRWLELKLDCDNINYKHFYLKGMFFSLERDTGFTKVTNITTGTLSYVVPPVEGHSRSKTTFHILEVSGDILGVSGCYYEHRELLYEVHHLNLINTGSPCWVKIKNIGNHALFMDILYGFMLKADDLAGIRANCIYYLNHKYAATCEEFLFEMVRMDIMTGTKEHCPCLNSIRGVGGWFVLNLWYLQAQ